MHIKILGPGCANCASLHAATVDAVQHLGLDATIEKIEDYGEIASYGLMTTPGLIVDDELVIAGKVPTAARLRELLAAR